MNKHVIYDNNKAYIRVNKRKARIVYNNGEDLVFVPVKLNPVNKYGLSVKLNKFDWGEEGIPFDKLVSNFEFFNCTNDETGRYTAYYVILENYFKQKRMD